MLFCNQAVMLQLKVRPGVLHEYAELAARPGVHLEITWSATGQYKSSLEFNLAAQAPLGTALLKHVAFAARPGIFLPQLESTCLQCALCAGQGKLRRCQHGVHLEPT